MGDTGFEQDSVTAFSNNDLRQCAKCFGPYSGPQCDETGTLSPDLALVVNGWSGLPEEAKADIVAMVTAAAKAE